MDDDPNIDSLEKKLQAAWHDPPPAVIPEGWQDNVMRAVRGAAGNDTVSPAAPTIHRILWKSALMAAGVAGILVVIVPDRVLSPSSELFRLIMLDPAGILRYLPIDF